MPKQSSQQPKKRQRITANRRPFKVAIGIDLRASYGRQKMQGIIRYIRANPGWQVITDELQTTMAGAGILRADADGLVGELYDPRLVEQATNLKIPVVNTSDTVEPDSLPLSTVNNTEIGELVARHFIERRPQNLYFIGPEDQHYSRKRSEGFRELARQHGLDPGIHRLPAETGKAPRIPRSHYRRILRSLERPCSVFCANDQIAFGLERSALEQNIQVPREVAIVGCNNDDILCRLAPVPLSSVDESAMEVGYNAAALLDALMRDPGKKHEHVMVSPSGLRIRASSDYVEADCENLESAIRYIREHVAEGIYVPDVLKAVSISRRSLEKQFQDALGHGIYEEILRTRIRHAQDLLRDTDRNLLDIARACGFNNIARFDIAFQKFTGMTPNRYRFRGGRTKRES